MKLYYILAIIPYAYSLIVNLVWILSSKETRVNVKTYLNGLRYMSPSFIFTILAVLVILIGKCEDPVVLPFALCSFVAPFIQALIGFIVIYIETLWEAKQNDQERH